MEELLVIRLADFTGTLSIGLRGAPEVQAAVETIATSAERQFYARLLGVTEARRFFEELAVDDAGAQAFADATRDAATRYAYCKIVEDSQDSLQAVNGVFMTDSATGEPVAVNRRLAATWNAMCLEVRDLRTDVDTYRAALRQALGLTPDYRTRDPFRVTNSLMI